MNYYEMLASKYYRDIVPDNMVEMIEALLHSFEMWFHSASETGCLAGLHYSTQTEHVIHKLILRLCGAGVNPANESFIWQLILQFHRP